MDKSLSSKYGRQLYYSTKHLTTNALYTSLKKAFKKKKAKSQKTSNKSKAPTILVQKDYGTMKKAREKHIAPGKKQAIDELRLLQMQLYKVKIEY